MGKLRLAEWTKTNPCPSGADFGPTQGVILVAGVVGAPLSESTQDQVAARAANGLGAPIWFLDLKLKAYI